MRLPESPLIHLWHLDLERLWQALSSALVKEKEPQAGAAAMTMAQLRVARRFYLRMLLGAYLGVAGKDVALVRGSRGKPVLNRSIHGEALHFSLAKSGHRALIGISGSGEVGVDLELEGRKPRNAQALSARFFTHCEAKEICGLDGPAMDAAFMRTWACKEAVAKASGHGIANRFCRFSVLAAESGPPRVIEDQDLSAAGWRVALVIPEEGYIAAVAVRQPSLLIEAFSL